MKKTNGVTQGVIQLAVNLGILVIVILGLSVLIKSDKLVARAGIIAAAAIILTLFQILTQRSRKDEKEEIVACMEEIASGKENVICMVEDEEVAKAVEAVKEKIAELNRKNREIKENETQLQVYFDGNFRNMGEIMGKLEAIVEEQSGAYRNLMESIEKTSGEIQEITAAANVAAETSQKTLELTSATVELATSGVHNVEKSLTKMGEIKENTDITAESVSKLEQKANEIGGIVEAITKISEQTNLLALNAAIEAARAGEAGKGFAVVAQEIRGLADESRKAAENINTIVREIQSQTRQATEKMNKTSEVVTEGSKDSASVGESLTIMLDAISKINNMMQDVAAGAEEQSANTHEIADQMEKNALFLNKEAENRDKILGLIKEESVIINGIKQKVESVFKK